MLHACGDVSSCRTPKAFLAVFAPRMWRCFPSKVVDALPTLVCSTHVEMFPACRGRDRQGRRLLHACGDVSYSRSVSYQSGQFAPHMWRCFLRVEAEHRPVHVCSTHVENFSIIIYHKSHLIAPRCGDVSCCISASFSSALSAPRMWRFYLSP